MVKLVGVPREGAGRAERGRRPTAGLGAKMRVQKCWRKKANSLSLNFITRVAPHSLSLFYYY